jgi:predicted tellurium resistance membrane protein TerC
MKYDALIDFNKYTLAVAAGGFVYAIEKFSPAKTEATRWSLLGVLFVLLVALMFGVAVYGAATKALHGKTNNQQIISTFGVVHLVFLGLGLLALGAMLVISIFAPAPEDDLASCCCPRDAPKAAAVVPAAGP